MNRAPEIVSRIEKLGGCLAVDADGTIRFRLPRDNPESERLLEAAKAERENLLIYLRSKPFDVQKARPRLAPCGSPDCAGCYDVGDGRKIHPPKCGESFLRWRAWLEGKGSRQ
jgi:hypothetical protein